MQVRALESREVLTLANREHRWHVILPFTIGQLNAGCSTAKKASERGTMIRSSTRTR